MNKETIYSMSEFQFFYYVLIKHQEWWFQILPAAIFMMQRGTNPFFLTHHFEILYYSIF